MFPRDFIKRRLFFVLRTAFRLTPMPVVTRDRLRQRFLDRHADLLPQGERGQLGDSSNAERRSRTRSASRSIGYVPRRTGILPAPLPVTLVAFYLPQFHPIPENDAWWGEGFTEWHNVTRALPQFEGHAQPRLPGELGFYDLRQPDVMRRQMHLAREYGIGAFCGYFYWFAGKTLLETPLQQWLADPTQDLPLCLCWANENWSRRWDGRANDILIGQRHSPADDLAFIEHVSRYLVDPRYLRVDGKPLLLVYRPGLLPDPKTTAQRWRGWCLEHGIGEIHLAYVQSFDRVDPRTIGFDAAVEFPPNNTALKPITAHQRLLNPDFRGDVYDWRELAHAAMAQPDPPYLLYPGVTPGWDNEPRRSGAGRVFTYDSPRGYRDWLRHAIATAKRRMPAHPLVFINAWNEWAEGAVLEPDAQLGHARLEATRDALCPTPARDTRPCAIVHVWGAEELSEIVMALRASGLDWRTVITTAAEHEQAVRERVTLLGINVEIEVFENRGREILPFLHVANRLLDEGVTTVLKLHSRRPALRQDNKCWPKDLFNGLLSPELVQRIVHAFHSDRELGLVTGDGPVRTLDANEVNTRYLCRRLGIAVPSFQGNQIIVDNMFWVCLDALRPLLDAHLDAWEFGADIDPADNTMADAVESMISVAVISAGFHMKDAAAI